MRHNDVLFGGRAKNNRFMNTLVTPVVACRPRRRLSRWVYKLSLTALNWLHEYRSTLSNHRIANELARLKNDSVLRLMCEYICCGTLIKDENSQPNQKLSFDLSNCCEWYFCSVATLSLWRTIFTLLFVTNNLYTVRAEPHFTHTK